MPVRRDFDAVAANWDEKPVRVRLADDIAAAMKQHLPLTRAWDVLELGCGTGLLTLHLAPLVKSVVAVDGSSGMLERLDLKIAEAGHQAIRTVQVDLERDELPPGPFHLITSAMLLHHIPDLPLLLKRLRGLLHPGGWIALADLDAEDGSFHEDATGIFHHGFSRERMTELLSQAGFSGIVVVEAADVVKGERHYPVLLSLAGC